MGDAPNNQGIITQGQHGNNTIIQGPLARRLPGDASDRISKALQTIITHGRIEVITDMMACPDCDGFAKQIEQIIRAAPNIDVIPLRNGMTMYAFRGEAMGVRDVNHIPQCIQDVISAFNDAGEHLTPIVFRPIDPTSDGSFIVANRISSHLSPNKASSPNRRRWLQ